MTAMIHAGPDAASLGLRVRARTTSGSVRETRCREEACGPSAWREAHRCVAMALLLAPALAATTQRNKANRAGDRARRRPVGAFTPAVSDPRLAAALARRGIQLNSDFRFTPASAVDRPQPRRPRRGPRPRRDARPRPRARAADAVGAPVTAITPSSYNLGVSVGWRRFAVSGDVAQADGGAHRRRPRSGRGRHELSRQPQPHRPGRGRRRARRGRASALVADDEAYSVDVGGAYSIARNLDVTAGARYRIAARPARAARATSAATARPSTSAPPSASKRRSRRRSPPSRKRRRGEPLARVARVHAAQRDHRQPRAGAASQAKRARPERLARRDGERVAKTGERKSKVGAGALGGADLGADCGPARCAGPAPRPRPWLPSAPQRCGLRGRAGEQQQPAARRATAHPLEQARRALARRGCSGGRRCPAPSGSRADRVEQAVALPLVGHQPEARQRLAAAHGASYSSRHERRITASGSTRSRRGSPRRPRWPAARRTR